MKYSKKKQFSCSCRFSLTLIDTLDTLAVSNTLSTNTKPHTQTNINVKSHTQGCLLTAWFDVPQLLNKTVEFEEAVRRVVTDVRLDNDIVVSVFETNIRVLG